MNDNSIDPGIRTRLSSPRIVFSLLFLLYMFDYIDRLVIVSLFPFLKQDWGISDTQCGLLVSESPADWDSGTQRAVFCRRAPRDLIA